MEIQEERAGDVILISPVGRLDSYSCREFETRLLDLIGPDGTPVVIDLARLDYVSSAGLRVLLMAAKKSRATNGRIALAALQPHVLQVFEISGFSSVFEIHDGREGALEAVS